MDLKAKSIVQQFTECNGYFGCSFYYQEGKYSTGYFCIIYLIKIYKEVKRYFSFFIYFYHFKLFFSTQIASLRTHEDVKEYFEELVKDETVDQVY